MAKKELTKQIQVLPPEAQRDAADFVDFPSKKYLQKDHSSSQKSILDSPFRGMWKGRKDMEDSTNLVRNIRKSQFAK